MVLLRRTCRRARPSINMALLRRAKHTHWWYARDDALFDLDAFVYLTSTLLKTLFAVSLSRFPPVRTHATL